MNKYINPTRLEIVVTNACSGRCRHCSWDNLTDDCGGIHADAAVTAVKRLAERYKIESVMTFGGEPLLFADTVCKIHAAARDCGIAERSIITNGYFTDDDDKINLTAKQICASGVNDILLSVDAFHQEFIPITAVERFAAALLSHGMQNLKIHPAWVINEENDNPYNEETRRLLKTFSDKEIPVTSGNDIFLSGSAAVHLSEFYPARQAIDLSDLSDFCGSEPYTERPDNVSCISISPNGGVNICSQIGNIYENDILDIIGSYDPYSIPPLRAVLDGGVRGLLDYADSLNVKADLNGCRSACQVCRKVRAEIDKVV